MSLNEKWLDRKIKSTDRPEDARSQFQRDKARVIHSAAFRRLQNKTQVIGSNESDFYRTRLTHSIEVAQVGVGILIKLRKKYSSNENYLDSLPTKSLIETICLAHDIGHPPYGHAGEQALNLKMIKHGGFEGNAQTIRIISEIDNYSEKNGMNLTRRTILGLLKYPVKYSDVSATNRLEDINTHPPKCYYDSSEPLIEWVLDPLDNDDIKEFCCHEITLMNTDNSKSKFKSLDCSIMELADDISYSIHDLEDAISLGLIKKDEWIKDIATIFSKSKIHNAKKNINSITKNLFSKHPWNNKNAIGCLVNTLINNIEIKEINGFSSNIIKLNVSFIEPYGEAVKILKKFHKNKIILRPRLQQLNFKGKKIISNLFEAFESDPENLLPITTRSLLVKGDNTHNCRVISDYISGMTNQYAEKMYDTLNTTGQGSMFQP